MRDWLRLEDAADLLGVEGTTLRAQPYRRAMEGVIRRRYEKLRSGKGRSEVVLRYEDCARLAEIRRRHRANLLEAARIAKLYAKLRG